MTPDDLRALFLPAIGAGILLALGFTLVTFLIAALVTRRRR